MTLEFCELRDRCGLALADVSAEFGEPLDAVFRRENGESPTPDRVLRSLAIMADFSSRPAETDQAVALLERPAVAIVGARNASAAACRFARGLGSRQWPTSSPGWRCREEHDE